MNDSALLFNPGPVRVHPSVWEALNTGDLCHREMETLSRLTRVREKLVEICNGDGTHDAILLTGSGTCALEAAIATAVPPLGTALVLDNGNYGERLRQIVASRAIDHEWLRMGWGQTFDLIEIERVLKARTFSHVLMVHHETSTSMLNPLAEVAAIAHRYGCDVIVDAVSSVGAEEIDVRAMGVDWLVGSSNKCLEGLPGMSFVCAKTALLESAEGSNAGLYLDLHANFSAQVGRQEPAFTPAVQVLAAWECALDVLLAEGVIGRRERYSRSTARIRERMQELGMKSFVSDGDLSCCTSVFHLPESMPFSAFHDQMRDRGYIIYHCPPRMGNVVRIATMGQLKESHVEGLLHAMTAVLVPQGGATSASNE
ncbi:pyridoxal-phosphate-dependent aminotransferase family protein [Kocuria sp.]|uniref:pyridoxal-phosphate-dependent aminotransferase family protein n=1 Tax=Kocuria sp. TaxID=1871328 RepID=UPI0026E07087|nr:aminotransferase class V-fold PLP-dependent enzyme [Kocuria sp.]MDO5618534.1 aminotransferase class V-fold PLP-dependent enzyme [Kocuria sp.]